METALTPIAAAIIAGLLLLLLLSKSPRGSAPRATCSRLLKHLPRSWQSAAALACAWLSVNLDLIKRIAIEVVGPHTPDLITEAWTLILAFIRWIMQSYPIPVLF